MCRGTMADDRLEARVGKCLLTAGLTLAVAESCTGGLICHRLTNVSGSSAYLTMGVVAYSNGVKMRLLGVPEETIADHGAVSEACVRAMARGVRELAGTHLGLAVSGIAGPTGGTPEKPVGTVHMALADKDMEVCRVFSFPGDRDEVKAQSAEEALGMVDRYCTKKGEK